MKALGICGSPRRGGNTEYLLRLALKELEQWGVETKEVFLAEYDIKPCTSCRYCVDHGQCCIDDDMSNTIVPWLLSSQIVIVASPVYFNNVSSYVKVFIDRTWCLRGRLKDKVGGGIVVGRGYGLESALTAIHSFMLKHEMILCHRGVPATAFEKGEIVHNKKAVNDVKKLAKRLYEVANIVFSELGYSS
ncbi:MAG: flavodoxin family protein [Thermoprotei archaeon]|nr:MAG: flavodoxin family protein [Thermoprotei archaeon]RLE98071.1 MAG: flavodoxin family protein [Thermoprotei archaeon]